MYGDPDRQVANIIAQNSLGNKVNSSPRIAVYITNLALDRERLADATYVGKLHIRERDTQVDNTPGSPTYGQLVYNEDQGRQYTVERLMPTPFKLTFKVDVWASNTEQKLQILEQLLVLFNPSLELQTTDNYVDWTSLTVLNLNDISWSSRSVPVGTDSTNDIATLTLETPIWLSPPVKVKRLGVVTSIITSLYKNSSASDDSYIEGLGSDPIGPTTSLANSLNVSVVTNSTEFGIQVYGTDVTLLGPNESVVPSNNNIEIAVRQGTAQDWLTVLEACSGNYVAGSSTIYLLQPNGSYVIGTFAINPLDPGKLTVNWNPDTLTSNTGIDSTGKLENEPGYSPASYRNGQPGSSGSPGTFDAIINPQQTGPNDPKLTTRYGTLQAGRRYLLIDDLGSHANDNAIPHYVSPGTYTDETFVGPTAWKNNNGSDFIAKANDIIEWSGTAWNIIFNAAQETTTMVWQTNIYTGVQYLWNGVSWVKSFEGEYSHSQWKIVL